jgi:drug/metabolite transporter (DMT)-like permease
MSIALRLRPPTAASFCGAVLAITGLYFLTGVGRSGGGFGYGELLILLAALAFSAHLLAVDHYTRRHDKRTIAFLQVAVVGVLGIGPTALFEQLRFVPTPGLFGALAVTSILATAVAFFVLNIVQSWTTPTRAAVIFAAEPVFAAVTSWLVEGEVLTGGALFGALLILAGVLTTELGPPGRRETEPAL